MPEELKWILELLDTHGYPVTVSIVFGYAIHKVFYFWKAEIEENKKNMKRQIDDLAAENRAYRLLFLRKMGLTESDLEQIFPAHKATPHQIEESTEN